MYCTCTVIECTHVASISLLIGFAEITTRYYVLCRTDNTRGISALILFPGSGHLFLTAGMDAGIRVSSGDTVHNPCNHIYMYMYLISLT